MTFSPDVQKALDQSPSQKRVTLEYIKNRIAAVDYYGPDVLGGTLTLCKITLDNGFTVTGQSACADPLNYNQLIGENIAYENAQRELWPLFGFLIKEKLYRDAVASSFEKSHHALNFFASCIKSGEDWSAECERAFDEAKKELSTKE